MKKIYFLSLIFLLITGTSISQNGWYQVSSTPNPSYALSFINIQTGYATSYQKIYKTTDGGVTWPTVYTSTTNRPQEIQFLNESTGYVYDDANGIFIKTNNGGSNWIEIPTGYGGNYHVENFYFIDENIGFLGHNINIYKTTNGGVNWNIVFNYSYEIIAITFINSNTGFASSPGVILKSTDQGNSWQTKALDSLNVHIRKFCIINSNLVYGGGQANLYQGYLPKMYKTSNTGDNWILMPTNSPALLSGICFIDSSIGYNANGPGIYYTTNSGLTWGLQYQSIGAATVNDICFLNPLTGYAGGQTGTGILKTTNGGLTPVQFLADEVPKNNKLLQNYPNPFNPSTKIKFDLPKLSNTKLIIYDVLGCELATLVNEQLKPGTYEVEWDGSNFASGIYFYQIVIEDAERSRSVETKRMILIK